jgi:hypothetical protein
VTSILVTDTHRQTLRLSHRRKAGKWRVLIDEEWRAVPGFPGYSVSDLGRVSADGVMVSPLPSSARHVKAFNGKVSVTVSIAALVLRAFVGPPPEGKTLARHLDDDETNNKLSNVAWGSKSDNYIDAVRNDRIKLNWVTDGTNNLRIKQTDAVPVGWRWGMTKERGWKHSDPVTPWRWITDGVKTRRFLITKPIPEGWWIGRVL